MSILSRRLFLETLGASALTLGAVLAPTGAVAQSVDNAALLAPGALPEKALGAANAPVTIVEYASMTCPHCARFHKDVFPKLKEKYVDTGKVRFVFREFPLDQLAAAASMLARCAPEDKFFEMVQLFFEHQDEWRKGPNYVQSLFDFVKQTGFTRESFDACLKNQQLLDNVVAVRSGGEKFGVESTPTFFVNGTMLRGAASIDEFDKAIQPHLKS